MKWFFPPLFAILVASCADPVKQEERREAAREAEAIKKESVDTSAAKAPLAPAISIPAPPKPVKKPEGIYHTVLEANGTTVEHIIHFRNNGSFRLQERWRGSDSVVTVEGTWNPSDGYIWLYRGQLVHGRYAWKGETLQYVQPGQQKTFAMTALPQITASKAWIDKGEAGTRFFGIGNEPFWSIELGAGDTLSFHLAEWKEPLRIKAGRATGQGDSTVIEARNDTASIKVVILSRFCSDGMSDYIYGNEVRLQYNQQSFSGCGHLYR